MMTPRHRLSVAILAVVASTGGCKPGREIAREITLHVELAGCASVRVGPVCELPPSSERRRLRLWVANPQAPLEIITDRGERLTFEATAHGKGRRVRFDVPQSESVRWLEVSAPSTSTVARWRLQIADEPVCPAVIEAGRLRRAQQPEAALAALTARLPDLTPGCRAAAVGLTARVWLDRDRPADAVAELRRAIALDDETGQMSRGLNDRLALSFVLTRKIGDLAAARAVLEVAPDTLAGYDEGQARMPYYRGLLAMTLGDLRAAMRLLAEAEARTARLGMSKLHLYAAEARANALQRTGRVDEADALLSEIIRRPAAVADPCARASLLANIGWSRLLRRETTPTASSGPAPRTPLEEARDLHRGPCPNPSLEANALVSLALAAIHDGQIEVAQSHLADARRVHPDPDAFIADWSTDLQGRIALQKGDHRTALALFDQLLAEAPPLSDARWRARLGRAMALEASGQIEGALDAYRASDRLVQAQRLLVALGEGRGAFLAARERGARRLVDLLLRAGRVDEAAQAARQSRSGVLSALRAADRATVLSGEARRAWEAGVAAYQAVRQRHDHVRQSLRGAARSEAPALRRELNEIDARARAALDAAHRALAGPSVPEPTLSPPPPGTLYLVYHPLEVGWVGFAMTDRTVVSARLPPIDADAPPRVLSKILLARFGPQIEGAKRVVVLPYGLVRRIDVHGLPWRNDILLAHVPVLYGLDAPASSDARPTDHAPPVALVVADPRGDLPAARQAPKTVAAALVRSPEWQVKVIGQTAATRDAVLRGIGGASLLHYAGHAQFAGIEGWDSALGLAGEGALTVGDILTMPRVPRWVVLSACETARTDARSSVPTLGLAQAFVVAGAEVVIATTRPVRDRFAAQVLAGLYRDGPDDLAAALRRTLLDARRRDDSDDWAAFRVWVR